MEKNKKTKDLLSKILEFSKKGTPLEIVCQKLEIDRDKLFSLVDQLQKERGYEIRIKNESLVLKKEAESERTIRLDLAGKKEIKILLISDANMGLKNQQGDLLATAYKKAEEEGVDMAIFAGNLCAGRPTPKTSRDYFLKGDDRKNRKKKVANASSLKTEAENRDEDEESNFRKQLDYLMAHYPKAPFNTYFVAGPRELTFKEIEGRDILKAFCANSGDKHRYCGDNKAIFVYHKTIVEVFHAKPGAEPYTKSYEIQGIGGKKSRNVKYIFPGQASTTGADIIVLGGRHVGLNIPPHVPRTEGGRKGVDLIEVPSLAEEGPSEEVRNILSGARSLGCIILTLGFFPDGSLSHCIQEYYDFSAYQKKNDYLESGNIDSLEQDLYALREEVAGLQIKLDNAKKNKDESAKKKLRFLIAKKEKQTKILTQDRDFLMELISMPRLIGYLARKFFKKAGKEEAKKEVMGIIKRLRAKGYRITEETNEKTYYWERTLKKKFKPVVFKCKEIRKSALISDTHLGNEGSREDLIKKSYEIAEEEKCEIVGHGGDVFDGSGAYPGQEHDLKPGLVGADAQREHGLEIWPVSNIVTVFISGSAGHENKYWQKIGHDIVKYFVKDLKCKNGEKLYFYTEDKSKIVGTFEVGNIKLMLRHPTGGAPKGRSYRPQEIVNRILSEIEKGTPEDIHAIGLGHLHIAFFMLYKGLAVYLIPCMEEDSSYLKGKTLIPDLGMWISEIGIDEKGNVIYVKNKYIAFESTKAPVAKIK